MLLAGAALCALAVRERPRLRYVFGGALLLAALPWLGWTFVAPGVVVAWALVVWTLRERRRLAALVAGEALAASLVFYATINDRFYGGLTPRAAGITDLPEFPLGYVERLPRLAGLWVDRDAGLLRWAPLLALVFFAGWLLYRSRRDQLARVAPARREAEACAGLLLGAAGPSSPSSRCSRQAGCAARRSRACRWSRRSPPSPPCPRGACATSRGCSRRCWRSSRSGASTWLVLAERSGSLRGWLEVDTNAPWGPPVVVFPNFTGAAFWPAVPVRPARRRRGVPVVARAPRGGRVAQRRRRLPHLQGPSLTNSSFAISGRS